MVLANCIGFHANGVSHVRVLALGHWGTGDLLGVMRAVD